MKFSRLALVLAATCCQAAYALTFICSNPPAGSEVAASKQARPGARLKLSLFDLEQAYLGQPLLLGNTWLIVFTYPAASPLTKEAFTELGASAIAAEKMARSSSLVDRGIRIVKTEDEMLDSVANNHPAAGFVDYVPRGFNVRSCF